MLAFLGVLVVDCRGLNSLVEGHMQTYSVDQIRGAERRALAQGRALMPLAGAAAADFVAARFAAGVVVLVLVGPGNNGGDALAAGQRLSAAGYQVHAVMPEVRRDMPSDAARAYADWRAQGGQQTSTLPETLVPDVVIDGLFGIGLNRTLAHDWQELVDAVNALGKPVLALDVPSGVDAESGQILGRPIRARWTLSFIAIAHGLAMPSPAQDVIGEHHLDTLGVSMAVCPPEL